MSQTISIGMATYNGATYLREQLDSFANQTRLPDELVVSDDDSTDDTRAIVDDFARTAPFAVRLHVNARRLGYNRNFEHAIGLCTGDIVFISDQDDRWFARKIEMVVGLMDARPDALVCTNDQSIVTADGTDTGATVLGRVRATGFDDDTFAPGCCTAIRRSALPLLLPFPGDAVPYDHWINIIPSLLGARVLCEQPLQTYRRHATNTTGSLFARETLRPWSLATDALSSDAAKAYGAKIAGNAVIADRLGSGQVDRLGLADRRSRAIGALADESAAYTARRDCIGLRRIARIPHVMRMLRGGTYDRFHGLRSAVKDLVI